jgi:hypothetical protein
MGVELQHQVSPERVNSGERVKSSCTLSPGSAAAQDVLAERVYISRFLSDLWPEFKSPFCALFIPVRFRNRGVHHGVLNVGLPAHRMEHTFKTAASHNPLNA